MRFRKDVAGFILTGIITILPLAVSIHDHCLREEALVDLSSEINENDISNGITINGTDYPAKAILLKDGKIYGCPCVTRICIPMCCLPNYKFRRGKCIPLNEKKILSFPPMYYAEDSTLVNNSWKPWNEEEFHSFIWDPCMKFSGIVADKIYMRLNLEKHITQSYQFLDNGTIFQNLLNHINDIDRYCFGYVNTLTDLDEYSVIMCAIPDPKNVDLLLKRAGITVSIPFFILTFLVYMILPELRNLHGKNFSCYIACLTVAYSSMVSLQYSSFSNTTELWCLIFAFLMYFSFLASFFWLNVMCFDIWWTFGGFRSSQASAKYRDRKKFIMYSIYAWGCALILLSFCLIMDLVPGIPDYLIKPQFNNNDHSCWFHKELAKGLYFYFPMAITVVCNIFLFVSTALKISKHNRETARHLRSSESKRHDDHKQWFNLYFKLFIIMGINWSMEILSWIFKEAKWTFYICDIINTLQGLIIFIFFVCKPKIKRLLQKRFGLEGITFSSGKSQSRDQSSIQTSTTMTPIEEKSIVK